MLKKLGLIKVLFFIAFCALFTSCDNFLSGALLKEEIQKEIDYANAQEIEILINPELNQGTTIPSGTYKKKAGYEFDIKFTEAANYQFYKWTAVNSDTGDSYDSVVEFGNAYSSSTSVTVKEKVEKLWIKPVCIERSAVEKKLPEMSDDGVSRDSTISFTFSKALSADNDFSKIEITSSGDDVSGNFKTAVVNDTVLTIAADKSKLLEVEKGKVKTVTVKIPADFYIVENSVNVPIGKEISHSYKINSTTTDKAEIVFSANAEKGTISPTGTQKYSIGESFTLSLEPASGFNFTQWSILDSDGNPVSDDVLKIEDVKSLSTEITVLQAVSGITVTPVVYERPAVSEASPSGVDKENCRDSSIYITFTKNISAENDFSTIKIECEGLDVTSKFKTPVLNENVLTFAADKTNLIEVADGKTKTVKVTVPRTIYYEEDEEKIPLAADYVFSYIINNTTNDKAEINFSVAADAGTISPTGAQKYNIGESFDLSFEPKEGYLFTGWRVKDSEGKNVVDSVLKIEDINSEKTTITVLDDENGITVTPNYVLLPAIKNYSPESSTTAIETNNSISVTFNTPIEAEYINFTNIYILSGGENITQYFDTPVLSNEGKSVTITPKALDLVNYINSKNAAYIDVKVSFTEAIKGKVGETEYSLLQNDKSSWSFRYKPATETTGPVKYDFEVSKNVPSVVTPAVATEGLLLKKEFTSFETDDYYTNHIKDTVYITGRFYDEESGVENVVVEEVRTNNKDTSAVNRTNAAYDYDFTTTYTTTSRTHPLTVANDGTGYTVFAFVYELKSAEDGAVKLNVKVLDRCGNSSEVQTVTVIIANSFDFSNVSPANYKILSNVSDSSEKNIYETKKKTITIAKDSAKKQVYENIYETVVFKCKYKNKNGIEVIEDINLLNQENKYEYTFDVDTIDMLDFEIITIDSNNTENTRKFSFPGKAFIYETYMNGTDKYAKPGAKGNAQYICEYQKNKTTNNYDFWVWNNPSLSLSDRELWLVALNGELYGEFSGPYTKDYNASVGTIDTNLVLKNLSFESCGPNTADYYVYAEIDENLWDTYDTLFIQGIHKGEYYDEKRVSSFGYRETKIKTTSVKGVGYLFGSPDEMTLYGIDKEGVVHNGRTIEYPPALSSLDNCLNYWNGSLLASSAGSITYNRIKAIGNDMYPIGYFLNKKLNVNGSYKELPVVKLEWWTDENPNVRTDGLETKEYSYDNYSTASDHSTKTKKETCIKFVDFDNTEGKIYLKGTDANGNFEIITAKYKFHPNLSYTINSKTPDSDTTTKVNFIVNNSPYTSYVYHYINSWKWNNRKWEDEQEVIQTISTGTADKDLSLTLDNNSWYKYRGSFSKYNVPDHNSDFEFGKYNYFYLGDPSTVNTLAEVEGYLYVTSDKPVFIHTVYTRKPYSDCKNWTAEKWDCRRVSLNEKVLNFTDASAQKDMIYNVQTSEIPDGACYVVIAYFADGTVKMTTVHQK